MIVGIDGHTIGHRHTGNETYAVNLLRAIQSRDGDTAYRIFLTPEGLRSAKIPASDNFTPVQVPASAWRRFAVGLPIELRRHPVDVLHVQYVAPWGIRSKLVTTIHDISYIHLPEQFDRLTRLRLERLFPATAHRAARVITGSQATKQDLMEHFGLPAQKITVTPYGVSPDYRPVTDRAALESALHALGLEGEYILYVGALQPRKNISRLPLAFDLLKQSEKIAEKLVIVGKKAWLYQDVLATHASLKHREDVLFLDYIPDADLPFVYSGARIFVFPSLYEGFGLPPLEAMACGLPVCVSSSPAMPEVVGEAGVFFDPLSIEAIAEAMHSLLKDPELCAELARRGPERAAQFTWDETARQTLRVYREVAEIR
jgi:glycosyltransferase involved in cell wall biosynthesis